jgi:glyoxylase-like metal-dependent hydrolase (beta-lactamase superfamily II)
MLIYQDAQLSIHRLVLNKIRTNCFIVQRGSQALIVDPTDQPEVIADYLAAQGLQPVLMLATHAHFDHVAAAGGLVARGLAERLYLHPADLAEYRRANAYSMMLFKRRLEPAPVAAFGDEQRALLADWGLALVHAGGHTAGSCYLHDQQRRVLITGDLTLHHRLETRLFDSRENVAEFAAFIDTVRRDFSPDAVLLPGHGDRSTVAAEAAHNRKWQYVLERQAA